MWRFLLDPSLQTSRKEVKKQGEIFKRNLEEWAKDQVRIINARVFLACVGMIVLIVPLLPQSLTVCKAFWVPLLQSRLEA